MASPIPQKLALRVDSPVKRRANKGHQWSPMESLVTGWGQFPRVQPRPTIGDSSIEEPKSNVPRCPSCREPMRYTSLQDLACQSCHMQEPSSHTREGFIASWQASRKQSVMVALVTVVSGFGVMLLALLAWGGRSELGAASLNEPVSAEQRDAWKDFEESEGEEWHSLPVIVQRAETSFTPLPTSWEREGRDGTLVWIYQGDASRGSLARFAGQDGTRLRTLLAKGTALRLTVQARRLELFQTKLVEIDRVEKLGWGGEHREFEAPHRTLSPPSASLTASAWLGPEA